MRRLHSGLVYAGIVLCLLAATANSQDKGSMLERHRFDSVPTILGPTVAAVGPRLNTRGKERTILTGQWVDENGKSYPVQVTHQLPDLVRLEGFGKNAPPMTFDGKKTTLRKSAADDALLETLAADTCEGMLAAIQKGAAVRLLGRFFKPDPKEDPKYKGEGFDVYEVTAPVSAVADQPMRMKVYSFDSSSGLLASTRYTDSTSGPAKNVEIRFSNWQKVDGSSYPGQIDRLENGHPVFSILWSGVSNSARVDSQVFSEVLTAK